MRPGLLGLEDAKEKVEVWRGHDNEQQPGLSVAGEVALGGAAPDPRSGALWGNLEGQEPERQNP
jgi:hypothetical protein